MLIAVNKNGCIIVWGFGIIQIIYILHCTHSCAYMGLHKMWHECLIRLLFLVIFCIWRHLKSNHVQEIFYHAWYSSKLTWKEWESSQMIFLLRHLGSTFSQWLNTWYLLWEEAVVNWSINYFHVAHMISYCDCINIILLGDNVLALHAVSL